MGKLHVNRLLHAQKKYGKRGDGSSGAFSGCGMGTRNTTQLMFRSPKHRIVQRAGAGKYASAYNKSYRGRLARNVIVDKDPAVSSAMMMRDPMKYAHAKEMNDCILRRRGRKQMSVANTKNAQAFVDVNPLHRKYNTTTTWCANTAGLM